MIKNLAKALVRVILLVFTFVLNNVTSRGQMLKRNRDLILKKQNERENKLSELESRFPLSAKKGKILKLSDAKLIEGLQKRTLSAVDVLETFIAKALQVTRKYNCVNEFVKEAQDWANELDEMDEVKGPLHGIPISIKENCSIKGMDSTAGFAQFLFNPKEEHAVIIKTLKELGAVPFCKTNIPQSLFTYGCDNPIYGETLNPLNPELSPGGSSGGESCLIAGGGSILGVGTDVGGSVRIPSHFCGTVGLKPTKLRMSVEGFRSAGSIMIPSSL